MKFFLIRIALFFVIVLAADYGVGRFLGYLQSAKAKGRTGVEYHVCKQFNEDIWIAGSSRASHHYVPQVFADSLGLSCFNGGQDGNGILMQYGRWKMLSKYHVPKLVIYDVEPAFDLQENDNERYVDRLKPYSNDKDVWNYIVDLFPMERFKLLSKMYRYNYKFLEILSDVVGVKSIEDGYIPLNGMIRMEMIDSQPNKNADVIKADDVKLKYLENLIVEVKASGSIIVLVASPYWKSHSKVDYSTIESLASQYNVMFFNYSFSDFADRPDLFADSMHLNDSGAREFSIDIAGKLKMLINR